MEKNSFHYLRRLANAWLPPLFWALFIYILSDQGVLPSFTEVFHDFVFKKLAHMVVYGVLYFLLHRALLVTFQTKISKTVWAFALVLTFVYAASDELHQMFVPGRYGTIRDVGYDMLGASVVLLRQYQYI